MSELQNTRNKLLQEVNKITSLELPENIKRVLVRTALKELLQNEEVQKAQIERRENKKNKPFEEAVQSINEEEVSSYFDKIVESSGLSLEEIEGKLKSDKFSQAKFLGEKESLKELISSDFQSLKDVGLSPKKIGEEMQKIVSFGHTGNMVMNGKNIKVDRTQYRHYRGSQENPFGKGGPMSSADITISDDSGDSVLLTQMHPWLIENFCFFQGEGLKYRVDPIKFAKIIGLIN